MPLISVLIPVYNGVKTIRDSLASIGSQQETDLEIIVVDDGSTDDTPRILNEMAAADKRIRVLTKENGGIVNALNAGLEWCNSEYVARHDADDVAYPQRFSLQLDYLAHHPECVAVSGSVRHIDGDGKPTGYVATFSAPDKSDPRWVPSKEPYLIHPFLMVRNKSFKAIGGYRYVFHAEDTDLYWRLQENGRLHNMADILGDYRVHEGSISSKSILNGRIAALNSQLAAISAVRRLKGESDILFPYRYLAAYQQAQSIDGMVALWKDTLTADEMAYLRLSSLSKLLELATHRTYELEEVDCAQMHDALQKGALFMSAVNRAWVNNLVANAGGRLMANGHGSKAKMLLPPMLYPAAGIRYMFRKFASPALRRKVKYLLGKQAAPTDFKTE